MSNLQKYPLEDGFVSTLSQAWTGAVGTVYVNDTPSFTFPSGVTTYIVVNPGRSNMQAAIINAYDSALNTLTVSSIAVNKGAGVAYTQQSHAVGSTVIISDNYQFWEDIATSMNSKVNTNNATVIFSNIYANAAARDADIPSPANGNSAYLTAEGYWTDYIAGAWVQRATGATPNASPTVAGKVEIATTAESIAGTDTGGTGATLSAVPSDIAKNTQSATFIYGTDVGGDDTYVVALTPVLAAYTTGQILTFKASTANTGACTIDFGPGAKSIKTEDGSDPGNGEVRAGVNIVQYDGTNFVLHANTTFTPSANIFQSAIYGETITAGDILQYQNDGKVYKWDGYASSPQTWQTGTAYTQKVSMCFIDTAKVVVVYKTNVGNGTLFCRVGTIVGETVTWGTQTTIDINIANAADMWEICKHDTNAFTVAYWDTTALSCRAVTVSGTTPTVGALTGVNSVTTNTLQTSVDICSPTTGTICVAYICGAATADIRGRVGTISGTTITFGTEVAALAANGAWASCCKLDTNKVLLGGVGTGSDIVSYVGSITGTAISFGTQAITAGTCADSSFMFIDTNIALIAYSDTSLKAMYVTSSGTANTHQTARTISATLGGQYRRTCLVGSGMIAFFNNTDNVIYTAKDTTNYTFDALNTIDYGNSATITGEFTYSAPEGYSLNRIFIAGWSAATADKNAYFLNANTRYLYGIAQESGVLDEVKKVAIPGNITTVNSGLLTSEKYYTTLTGGYTLNPTTLSTGAYVGKALSATSMLVGINNSTL